MKSDLLRLVLVLICAAGCAGEERVSAKNPRQQAKAPAVPSPTPETRSVAKQVSTSIAAGVDWPHWRGPEYDGISRETGWSTAWPASGPKKLWEAQVGTGFSSFSVSRGKLYTMGHREGIDTVYCFDADKGDELWSYSYKCAIVDNLHEGGPAATPTVDQGHVYTVSKEGHLFCFTADKGAIVWKHDLRTLLEVGMPEWGFSCSPLVLGEMLIIEAGRTVALDKTTGKLIWQTGKYRPGYGSPAAFRHAGETLIAVLNNDCLLVVRAKDGEGVAEFPWETDYATTATTPIVVDDTIFISSGYRRGCALLKLVGNKLEVIYENKNMCNHMSNCILWEGHLYGFDGNSHNPRLVQLVCMDFATGKVAWKRRGLGCGTLFLSDGKLVLLSDEGELVIAAAQPTKFEDLAHAQVIEGRCWTVPVLSHGKLYCRNADGDVVCLDLMP